jgi:hypothetical protein
MSRNGSGTYNLPAGNPVVTGTTISSTWANNTLSDIATALTNSVSADGQTPITGALTGTSGTVAFGGVGQTRIPAGTTAQRSASPQDGMIRYNTDLQQYEGYKNSAWSIFGNGAGGTLFSDTITATQGQTVINMPTGYVQGGDNLSVYVNGSRQIYNVNYTETSTTSFTFSTGLNVGDLVNYTIGASTSLSVNAASVLYNEGGTGAVNRNAEQKFQETLSVTDFGAVGNGLVDDTAAVQNAINAASTTGAVLYFPAGTYNVLSTSANALTALSNVKLQGVKGVTTIFLTSATTDTAIIGSSSLVNNFLIDSIIFDGNKSIVSAYDVYCVKFDNINWFQATNSTFQNSTMDGILLGITTLAKNALIDTCIFQNIGVSAIGANGVRVYNNEGLVINNCDFYNFIVSAIDTNPTAVEDLQTNVVITNNYIENDSVNWLAGISSISLLNDRTLVQGNTIIGGGSGGQIVVHDYPSGRSVRDYRILGNSFLNSVGVAIVINQDFNTDIIVSGNNIKGAVSSGIFVVTPLAPPYTGSNPVIISSNIIEDTSTATYTNTSQPACINIGQAQNVIVSNNQCITPRWAGIAVQSGSNKISVQGNSIIGQKGQAPTNFLTNVGAGIVVSPAGVSFSGNTSDVLINGNFIYNFLTTVSPPSTSVRVGGIAVYNDSSGANSVNNITITNNVIRKGNGIGIQTYFVENCTISGNTISDVFGSYFDTSSTSVLLNPIIGYYSAAPTTGSWQKGVALYNSAPASGGYVGWVCTNFGTFGTLIGVTGSITINTNVLTVNSATNLALGQYIQVAGVTPIMKIIAISGTTISVDTLSNATVTSAAVSFSTPVFRTFGLIS